MHLFLYLAYGYLTLIASSEEYHLEPVGPLMCRSICSSTLGCSSHNFLVETLTCVYTDSTIAYKEQSTRFKDCPKGAKLFPSRKGNHLCFKIKRKAEKTKPGTQFTKLHLIPMTSNSALKSKLFHLDSKTVTEYPFPKLPGRASAVVYVPSLGKTFLSIWEPAGIYLSSGSVLQSVRSGDLVATSFAVDEKQGLLFMTLAKTHFSRTVSLMFLNTLKIQKCIYDYSLNSKTIVTDTKRSLLYLARVSGYEIQIYNYHGVPKGSWKEEMLTLSLFIDNENDVLYYIKGKNTYHIYKKSLSNNLTTKIVPFNVWSGALIVQHDAFYITGTRFKKYFLFFAKGNQKENVDIGVKGIKELVMCPLP